MAKRIDRFKLNFPNIGGAWLARLSLTAAAAVVASTAASTGGPTYQTEFINAAATVGTGAGYHRQQIAFVQGRRPDRTLPANLASWNDPKLVSKGERCMAQAVYFEARGEPFEGQLAVAHVVLNRVRDERYPNDTCAVVFENETWRHRCQFSFACDGRSDRPRDFSAWVSAIKTARMVSTGQMNDVTQASTHYHADYVAPEWAARFRKTVKIGRHNFYRNETEIR